MIKKKDYVLIGKIVACFGIKGQVKLFLSNDFKKFVLENYKKISLFFEDESIVRLKSLSEKPTTIYAQIEGVNNRTDAEKLGKPSIYCKKKDLPSLDENEYFYSDLVNLDVYSTDEEGKIGKIVSVNNFGAGDIVEIEFNSGITEMFPFNKEIFLSVEETKVIIKKPIVN